jgi:hypothetical protein
METIKKYINMAKDNKKTVIAGVIVLIIIITLVN